MLHDCSMYHVGRSDFCLCLVELGILTPSRQAPRTGKQGEEHITNHSALITSLTHSRSLTHSPAPPARFPLTVSVSTHARPSHPIARARRLSSF